MVMQWIDPSASSFGHISLFLPQRGSAEDVATVDSATKWGPGRREVIGLSDVGSQ